MHAFENGAESLADYLQAIFIGEFDPNLSRIVISEALSEQLLELDTQEEQEDFLYILSGVLDCWRNPGEYIPERPARPRVPVGRVSSMNPGIRGSVELGYETNALDVIGDNNARNRQQ